MLIEAHYPQRHVEAKVRSIAAFKKNHPGAYIDAIDDRIVIVFCESCGGPFYEGDKYNKDEDGIAWHRGKCPPKKKPRPSQKRSPRS